MFAQGRVNKQSREVCLALLPQYMFEGIKEMFKRKRTIKINGYKNLTDGLRKNLIYRLEMKSKTIIKAHGK